MNIINALVLTSSLILLSGCMSNFVRPANDALVAGKSTRANVIQIAGEPFTVNDNVQINNEKVQTATYLYLKGAKFYGMIIPTRTLTYTFFNDVMVGNEFNSSFEEESTEFDGTKVASIAKGKSTKADVIAIMGKPSGDILYPLITDKIGSGVVYAYTVSRHAPFVAPTTKYLLVITLDKNDVVSNISYKIDGKEQIAS